MSEITVTNWFGDIVSHPRVVVEVHSVDDIIRVLKDSASYPSPVRAVGSNHSLSRCGVAENGTLLKMEMKRVLHIGTDSVTVEAGAEYIDIAKELESKNLQFFVNTEIGNLSAGSAACAGTKDGSMFGEYGQVGSYVTGIKMVLPNGQLLEVREANDPELMRKIRSSYGTFGILYEVTFRVRPLTPMSVHHVTFELEEFIRRLPELQKLDSSMMMFLFPFANKITVEFRKDNPHVTGKPNRKTWAMRNDLWAVSGPRVGGFVGRYVWPLFLRHKINDFLNWIWRVVLEHRVKSDYTIPADQIIRYPPLGGPSKYTFSLFAFPQDQYPAVIRDFYQFCRDYFREKRYRVDLLSVGYAVARDQHAVLSYSYDGPAMTIDPVSTGNPGWTEFLAAFNQFCSDHNGAPLLNQTAGLTPAIVRKAFGERLKVIADTRKTFDPGDRLLNDYFRSLFA